MYKYKKITPRTLRTLKSATTRAISTLRAGVHCYVVDAKRNTRKKKRKENPQTS